MSDRRLTLVGKLEGIEMSKSAGLTARGYSLVEVTPDFATISITISKTAKSRLKAKGTVSEAVANIRNESFEDNKLVVVRLPRPKVHSYREMTPGADKYGREMWFAESQGVVQAETFDVPQVAEALVQRGASLQSLMMVRKPRQHLLAQGTKKRDR